jgi:hypothetical protein
MLPRSIRVVAIPLEPPGQPTAQTGSGPAGSFGALRVCFIGTGPAIVRVTTIMMLLALTGLATTACRSRDGTGRVSVQRDTIGDTIVVRTLSGSAWGDSLPVVEEMRIGSEANDSMYFFAQLKYVRPDRDGNIYVFDDMQKTIRFYDADGKYVRSFGRVGKGPGEYQALLGMRLLPNGNLAIADPFNARMTILRPTGEVAGTSTMWNMFFAEDMIQSGPSGSIYVRIPSATRPAPGVDASKLAFEHRDSTGKIIDTLMQPSWPKVESHFVWYGPHRHILYHPSGHFVMGNSAAYAIELPAADGHIIRMELANQTQTPIHDGERKTMKRIIDELARDPHYVGNAPSLPSAKPFFRQLATDEEGRIWVQVHGQSVAAPGTNDSTVIYRRWIEPNRWDLFQPDGTYLGRIHLPQNAEIMAMRGELIWGTVTDENENVHIVRWRIQRPKAG